MPPLNQPRRLVTLAERAVYGCIVVRVIKNADKEYIKFIAQREITKKLKPVLEAFGDTVSLTTAFGKNLETLPARYLTESMNKMLSGLVGFLEDDVIEDYLDDKASSFKHKFIRGLFVMLKYMLSYKVTDLNLNLVGTEYTLYLARYFEDKEYDESVEKQLCHEMSMRHEIFYDTIAIFKDNLIHLTSLGLQNLASSKLLWTVCCSCPNLQNLDISGNFFDISRLVGFEDKMFATYHPLLAKKNHYICNFVKTLCAIYGKPTIEHMRDQVQPHRLHKLKTLRIPCLWKEAEAKNVAYHMKRILLDCRQLQEVEGVNLFEALDLMTDLEIELHGTLTLRKLILRDHSDRYDAKPILQKLKLPWVEDVYINLTERTGTKVFLNFPNMRHLTVRPYCDGSYNLANIFPYLRNLHTLDISFCRSVSIGNICQIAEGCRSLTSLSLHSRIFNMITEGDKEGGIRYREFHMENLRVNGVPPDPPKFDPEDVENMGYWNARLASQDGLWLMDDIDPVWYENDSNQIPKLERLHTLQIADYEFADPAAIYKCIKGSPNIQTLYLKALVDPTGGYPEPFDDLLVFRIAKILKRVKDVKLEFFHKDWLEVKLKRLTSRAVHYIINYCDCIESIGCLASWNVSSDEVFRLNQSFREQNFILKLITRVKIFENTVK